MIEKELEAITKQDIDDLITNAEPEGRTLDYKEQLPGSNDEEKKKFLADVSAFANAGGGDLIYGVREKRDGGNQPTGIPDAADGLKDINAGQEELRLMEIVRTGIDPRIQTIQSKTVDGFPLGPVIILRVQKSWDSPHMIKFKEWNRFYVRVGKQNSLLDVREIRASFLASESIAEKISAFRSERIGKILTGEIPMRAPLEPGPKIVLHLLPLQSFSQPNTIDIRGAKSMLTDGDLMPMGPKYGGWGPIEFNFNGLINCARGHSFSYVQLFRNGAIEAVCSWVSVAPALDGIALDQEIINATRRFLKTQERCRVGLPTFVCVTAVSVEDFLIELPDIVPNFHPSSAPIGPDVLLAPEILLDESAKPLLDEGKAKTGRLVRSALDTIWQAAGWPGSQGFSESGDWLGAAALIK
jgi:hypothetical protein